MYTASLLAILASTAMSVGLYFMKREAERLPALGGGWRFAAWSAFVRDRWWLRGLALQITGFALYLAALRAAPLSIVHTAMDGGIALFVLLAVIGLGERMRAVEWLGVSAIVAGLVALGVSLSTGATGQPLGHGFVTFSLVLATLAGVALIADRTVPRAIGLSVASGLALGLGSVYAKALAGAPSFATVESAYVLLTLAANLVGFVLQQASFQAGRAVVVMPLSSVVSNFVPIIGGIIVFDESLPAHGTAAILRPLAFALAIGGVALLAGFGEPASASAVQVEDVRSR